MWVSKHAKSNKIYLDYNKEINKDKSYQNAQKES